MIHAQEVLKDTIRCLMIYAQEMLKDTIQCKDTCAGHDKFDKRYLFLLSCNKKYMNVCKYKNNPGLSPKKKWKKRVYIIVALLLNSNINVLIIQKRVM